MLVLVIKKYLVLSLLRSNKIFFKEFLYCYFRFPLFLKMALFSDEQAQRQSTPDLIDELNA